MGEKERKNSLARFVKIGKIENKNKWLKLQTKGLKTENYFF